MRCSPDGQRIEREQARDIHGRTEQRRVVRPLNPGASV
jgi:hypothetical protein